MTTLNESTNHIRLVDTIKQLCKSNGTSISKIEKDLWFGHNTIYKWEKHSPSIEKVLQVARYLNVSVLQLIHNSDCIESSTPIEPTELDKLHAAFEEAVQVRLHEIQLVADRFGQLPIDPVDNSSLMIAVNTEAHVRYWKAVYNSEQS
ncbi:helix-turn-helix domain-containing protein [Paenibacillus sinopodophylli]|uniref:helix-turn-helix domain-containing protein n=1 Tax=Paenibacillus sinopodophylli TaxID=1837342 RepID=UPI00110C930D|nr:helix-turn-helix transcriptional regulator [Paenibacillus sinopodophylli]